MARVNFYELLEGLSVDQKNIKVINKAIDDWYNDLTIKYNQTKDSATKNKIKAQLALKAEMEKVMNDTKLRMQEANDFKEKNKIQVENLAFVLSQENKTITNAFVGNIVKKYGLKRMEVISIFKKHQLEVVNNKNEYYDENFLRTQMDEINTWISEINKPNIAQKYSWIPAGQYINNLYDLLACYNHQPNMSYANKSTHDLFVIAEKGDKEYSMKTGVLEGQKLFSKAKNDAFANDDTRRKYNNSLQLMGLESFLNIASNVSEDMKRDSSYAEAIIKKIQTKFPDYHLALAIYNQKLNLVSNPYVPEKSSILIYCGKCHTASRFASVSESKSAKCPVCGEPFYKKCPGCGKIIPTSALRCTSCHVDLIEYSHFDSYYKQAMDAINNLDISEAKNYINKAKQANPLSSKLTQLENNLKAIQNQYEAPLKQLQYYIQNHDYITARNYMNNLKNQYPKLNLSNQESTVQAAINSAQQIFKQKGENNYEAANACVRVLRLVRDFPEAKNILNKVAPRPIKAIHATMQPYGVLLNWNAAEDIGVTYVLIRNNQHIPTTIHDGSIIKETSTDFQYLDKNVESGKTYYYGLFVKRSDIYSTIVTTYITLFNEIDKDSLQYTMNSNKVVFSWKLPKNAIGARVLRCNGGSVDTAPSTNTICMSSKAINMYTDDQIEKGKMYQYRFQTIYQVNGKEVYTDGVVYDLISEDIPLATTIVNATYNEATKKIVIKMKSSTTKSYKIQIIDLVKPFGRVNQDIDISQIGQYGKIVAMGDTTNSTLEMSAMKDKGYHLGIVTIAGTKAILGNSVNVSTFVRCDIDKVKSKVVNNRLHIHMVEPVASNVESLYYAYKIKPNSNSKPPYLSVDDIDDMRKISVEQYNKQHCMTIDNLPQKELYITVIPQMKDNGKTYFAQPAKLFINNSPKKKLSYEIHWLGVFKKDRTNATLSIHTNGCTLKDFEEWPTLYLVGRKDQHIPKQYNDRGNVTICKISEKSSHDKSIRLSPKGDWLEITFNVPGSIPSKAPLRLFVDEFDANEFELLPMNDKSLIVP